MKSKTFTDPRDGKVYKIVRIGEQVWMAENLNFDCPGSKCYDNDPKNAEKYGRLYDWETAMKVCPPGWHLPSREEWETLINFAGGDEIAGKKLKAKSDWYWKNNCNGTDDYGFSALPGGFGSLNDNGFGLSNYFGRWWSTTEHKRSDCLAYHRGMNYALIRATRSYIGKFCLFSVRCVQDSCFEKEESK